MLSVIENTDGDSVNPSDTKICSHTFKDVINTMNFLLSGLK